MVKLPLVSLTLLLTACGGGGGSDHGTGSQAAEEGDYDNARAYETDSPRTDSGMFAAIFGIRIKTAAIYL